MEQLIRENEKLDGQSPDPHQTGGSSGQEPAEPAEGDEDEGGDGNNPHNPETARRRGLVALRELVISEQIKQAIKGGQTNES